MTKLRKKGFRRCKLCRTIGFLTSALLCHILFPVVNSLLLLKLLLTPMLSLQLTHKNIEPRKAFGFLSKAGIVVPGTAFTFSR